MRFIAAQLKIHPHLRGTIIATLFVIFERYDSCPKNIPLVASWPRVFHIYRSRSILLISSISGK